MPTVRLHEIIAAIPSAIREGRESTVIEINISIIMVIVINILLKRVESHETRLMVPYLSELQTTADFKTAHQFLSAEDTRLCRRFDKFCSPDDELLHATPEYETQGLELLKACVEKSRSKHGTGNSVQAASS